MSDFIISQIRTYVPMAVGGLVAWLATIGIQIDTAAAQGLVAFLTPLCGAIYYLVIRSLEKKYPNAGWLLGIPAKPKYPDIK